MQVLLHKLSVLEKQLFIFSLIKSHKSKKHSEIFLNKYFKQNIFIINYTFVEW